MNKRKKLHHLLFCTVKKLLSFRVTTSVHNAHVDVLGIAGNQVVCYILRTSSLSDLAVVDLECQKAKLPLPNSPLTEDDRNQRRFCFLTPGKQIMDNSLSLDRLTSLAEQGDVKDVLLVPVSVFWGRAPDKEKSAFKLLFDLNFSPNSSLGKLFAILFHGNRVMVHFNSALSLKELIAEGKDHPRTVRKAGRILRVHFRQLKTSAIGPELSDRSMLINGLLKTPAVRCAVETEAETRNISQQEATNKARNYLNEITSDYSYPVLRLMDRALTWFWNRLYDGVLIHNAGPVKALSQTSSIVYVPCHRSHIDYLLLSYAVYYEGLTPPHIAAGINLNMPVVGTILRKSGAFFMRRTFRGNPLYGTVFHEYLHTLTSRGFPVEYFVEGGRSRTGRTLSPKTGLISISLQSYLRNPQQPVVFVPVYIGYERVMEVDTYVKELGGKEKKKESPLDIVRTLFSLRSAFGKAWINFGNPIHLDRFLNDTAVDWRNSQEQNGKAHWLRKSTGLLAQRIATEINAAAVINPVNLLSAALLSAPKHTLGERELIELMDIQLNLLRVTPYSNCSVITEMSGSEILQYGLSMGLIIHCSDSLGNLYQLSEKTAVQMTYYRNNVTHLLVVPALLGCLFYNNATLMEKEVFRISSVVYPYLKAELFLPWSRHRFLAVLRQWLASFTATGLITYEAKKYWQPALHSPEHTTLNRLSGAITQILERYFAVISLLINSGSDTLDQATLEQQSRDLAQRLSAVHNTATPEQLDRGAFKQFIEQLRRDEIIETSAHNTLCFGDEAGRIAEEARKLLSGQIRHNVQQAIRPETS